MEVTRKAIPRAWAELADALMSQFEDNRWSPAIWDWANGSRDRLSSTPSTVAAASPRSQRSAGSCAPGSPFVGIGDDVAHTSAHERAHLDDDPEGDLEPAD